MKITVPDDIIAEQLSQNIIDSVTKYVDSQLKLIGKTGELPPYPNKVTLRKVLKVSDEKLSDWQARGLKFQHWSKQDIRVDRDELQRFLKETFEV